MPSLTTLPLRARNLIASAFHGFGIHCATHPKRVILISGVVILSLFYPANELYFSSNTAAHNRVYSLFASYQPDLRDVWDGHDALLPLEDSGVLTRCGAERTLRVERILIPSSEQSNTGAATPETLQFASKLNNYIAHSLKSTDSSLQCVRGADNECFILSPTAFFPESPASYPDGVLETINHAVNTSIAGVPVDLSMVLAMRLAAGGDPNAQIEHVGFLALTYFFTEKDCSSQDGHRKWLELIRRTALDHFEAISMTPFVVEKSRYAALQYDPTLSRPSRSNLVFVLLNVLIIGIFYSVSGSIRRMTGVHSRVGLASTAAVECCASTMASISVCSLAGFRLTMVPWTIHLVMVVFIGAENMFLLIDKVTSTSVSLSVKQRMGAGLASAGTTITLNTLAYNSILGTIAFFTTGAIREFCIFAIVLLVAHWFLVHTLFIAVLSIDLQRLELSDVLGQDDTMKPMVSPDAEKSNQTPITSKRRRAINSIQHRLRVMPSKNGSLLLMLTVTASLYYLTYPFQRPTNDADTLPFLQNAFRGSHHQLDPIPTPSLTLWNILNPDNDPYVHIRIETPVIVALNPRGNSDLTSHQDLRNQSRWTRRIIWMIKIMVVPIATTSGALYLLLLYLLRGADQLEAYRTRPDDTPKPSLSNLEDQISFTTLSRVFATDVARLDTNQDGSVIAMLSSKNELAIWNDSYQRLDVKGLLIHSANDSGSPVHITCVTVDKDGHYCAIGTDSGIVALWLIPPRGASFDKLPHSVAITVEDPVLDLAFIPETHEDRSTPSEPSISRKKDKSILLVCDNGTVSQANPLKTSTIHTIPPTHVDAVLKGHLVRNTTDNQVFVAYTYVDGVLELMNRHADDNWKSICTVAAGNPMDVVDQLTLTSFSTEEGQPGLILATATVAGVVSIWDTTTGDCICLMESAFGQINRLRIAPITPQNCQLCGLLSPISMALTISVGYNAFVYRLKQPAVSDRCNCSVTQKTFVRDSFGRRSRSSSTASISASSSPPKVRSRLSSMTLAAPNTDISEFPVSPHGIHPRRAGSDRDPTRRISGSFSKLPVQSEPNETVFCGNPHANDHASSYNSLSPEYLADISFERGGWDLLDGHRLVGLRRRLRLPQNGSPQPESPKAPCRNAHGELPNTVLDRWELWAFDPGHPECDVRVSTLLALASKTPPSTTSKTFEFPRLPFTRISSITTSPSSCVAGFGNTTGIINLSRFSA